MVSWETKFEYKSRTGEIHKVLFIDKVRVVTGDQEVDKYLVMMDDYTIKTIFPAQVTRIVPSMQTTLSSSDEEIPLHLKQILE